VQIIDVREPEEFNMSHVEGSINLPLSRIMADPSVVTDLPKDETLVIYCNSGNRSGQAQQILNSYGIINVENGINQDYVESHYTN
jgi:phage shock protein E